MTPRFGMLSFRRVLTTAAFFVAFVFLSVWNAHAITAYFQNCDGAGKAFNSEHVLIKNFYTFSVTRDHCRETKQATASEDFEISELQVNESRLEDNAASPIETAPAGDSSAPVQSPSREGTLASISNWPTLEATVRKMTSSSKLHCPLPPDVITACNVTIVSPVCCIDDEGKTSGTRYTGRLYVNNTLAANWTHEDKSMAFIFLFDSSCQVKERKVFSFKDGGTSNSILRYLMRYDSRTFFGGVVSGPFFPRHDDLRRLGVLNTNNKKRGNVVFVGRVMHQGHTDSALTHVSGRSALLTRIITFGIPYKYIISDVTYSEVVEESQDLLSGGSWYPQNCQPRWRIAIIIPFRNRERHLWIFLRNMITFLKMQNISFTFFVIEQSEPELFNRAALMNIGYVEAKKLGNFDCFVFHDVDLIPEDLTNAYSCSEQPRHLAVSRSAKNYRRSVRGWYEYFGGAIMMTAQQIEQINGFPNSYFGWGGEDDEILARLKKFNETVLRYPTDISGYISLPHGVETGNPHISRTVNALKLHGELHFKEDGLNRMNYTLLKITEMPIYTNITVRIPGPTSASQIKKKNADRFHLEDRLKELLERIDGGKHRKRRRHL